ncbi:LacI family DNA-binding transcriptional regulator [Streptomyces sp. NPDC051940]|uniref:LacI family DNA-binding transcriptional regulator n=1 Tax=Streptomyces sp. NPDC051940 TaxID=3155675 RepID=UPI00341D55EC
MADGLRRALPPVSRAGRRGRPTLEQVAARAGVGRGTVSRVINGSQQVSAEAKAAVERAIAELGYVPNRTARALAAGSTDAVALVIPEPETRLFSEPYFSDMIHGISAAILDADKQLLLTLSRTSKERARLAGYLSGNRVDGVLLISVHQDDKLPDLLAEQGIPAVVSGRRSQDERLPFVDTDNVGGGRAAVEHLIARGRREIAVISGRPDVFGAQCRIEGYRQALKAAGLPDDPRLVVHGDFTEESGRQAMRELLARRPSLDAVFAGSDLMAAGALQVLRGSGRRVPEDVALVGFDDSPVARHTDPPLTSVRQPTEAMGREMVRVLLAEIAREAGAGEPVPHALLPTELVVRASA